MTNGKDEERNQSATGARGGRKSEDDGPPQAQEPAEVVDDPAYKAKKAWLDFVLQKSLAESEQRKASATERLDAAKSKVDHDFTSTQTKLDALAKKLEDAKTEHDAAISKLGDAEKQFSEKRAALEEANLAFAKADEERRLRENQALRIGATHAALEVDGGHIEQDRERNQKIKAELTALNDRERAVVGTRYDHETAQAQTTYDADLAALNAEFGVGDADGGEA